MNHLNGISGILKEGESMNFVNKVKALFVEVILFRKFIVNFF